MRPGVCTAPEPAPERDRPSEGCQLEVRYYGLQGNYVYRLTVGGRKGTALPCPYVVPRQMLSALTCLGAGSCDRNTIRIAFVSRSMSQAAMRGRTNSSQSTGFKSSGVASRNSINFIRFSR